MADLQVVAEIGDSDAQRIVEILAAHGDEQGFYWDRNPVGILIKDRDTLIGGLSGDILFNWFYVSRLAVAPESRDEGHGRKLMEEAERVARERGCAGIWLNTYSFQAPDFYRKLGFAEFGALENNPRGGRRYFLRKYF